jgi:hypothetical protein
MAIISIYEDEANEKQPNGERNGIGRTSNVGL